MPQASAECMFVQALVALADRAACDVRSCLNTLQFLAKQGRRVRAQDVTALNMGQKDLSTGAFAVWNRLLTSKVDTLSLVQAMTLGFCRPNFQGLKLQHCHALFVVGHEQVFMVCEGVSPLF